MSDDTGTMPGKRRRKERTGLHASDVIIKEAHELVGRTVLERYVIEDVIGAGAMGSVFRGRHTKLKRSVAIKILHDHLAVDPTMLRRFKREATVAARLSHPNVVAVLDIGETEERRHVMVLELADGRSLTDVMKLPLSRPRLVNIIRQLLRGLEHAHGCGLVHRDLKPDNVIVGVATDGTDVPRIVDFGIAALRDPDDTADGGRLTSSGIVLGTPQYMAPEQAKGERIDHRVDLFALGVIVYELLAGCPPFTGTAMEVALANINKDPPPIDRRAPGVSVDPLLEAYARKLMARHVDQRFSTAFEALEVLELIDRDPAAASLALGKTDVTRALSVISLPDPPDGR